MAEAVLMPKTGITVESCIIEEWKKQVGDHVKLDEILFTYETDKAVFECPSTAEGELLEIYYQDGDEVPCLETVCAVGQKGDDCSAIRPSGVAAQAPAAVPATAEPAAPTAAAKAATAPTGETSGALAAPRAKNLAAQAGVAWRKAVPTGSKGLIVERDVRKLMEEQSAATAATPAPVTQAPAAASAPAAAAADYTDSKFSVIRRTIARSMKEALGSAAQLTHNFAFDATAIKQYRAETKALGGAYAGVTIGDMILYVVSRTLLAHPDLNAHMLDDGHIRHFTTVHLGVAVAPPRGLLVPVIRAAEKKRLLQVDGEAITAQQAASLTNKLLQLCNGSLYDDDGQMHQIHRCKLDAFDELIDQLDGQKALVLYHFRFDEEQLVETLKHHHSGLRVAVLRDNRDAAAWNAGEIDVLLAQPASCAYGLNLQQGGHHLIWYSMPWSLELYAQGEARLYRQGQKQSVIVHRLIVKHGADELVVKALNSKELNQNALMQALKSYIKERG